MKRYRFRLEQVRRVRAIELDRAAAEVARARRDRAAAGEHTEALLAAYHELHARPTGSGADDLRRRCAELRLAVDAISAARRAEARCDQEVTARLDAWVDADRAVRLLDQLDERSRARHEAGARAEEQQVLDDLVTSRLGRAS